MSTSAWLSFLCNSMLRPLYAHFVHAHVQVTVQYRLGPFGYLALEELRERDVGVPGVSPGNSTGNYGTQVRGGTASNTHVSSLHDTTP